MKRKSGFYLLMLAGLSGLCGCAKEESPVIPIIEKPAVYPAARLPYVKDTFVTLRSPSEVLVQFKIADDGEGIIEKYGVCWSTSRYPTTADNCVVKTVAYRHEYYYNNHFHFDIVDLNTDVRYYLRAFAVNNLGKTYGEQISFTTPVSVPPPDFDPDLNFGSVTDADGNNYKTIQIGSQTWNQTWIAENLKTTKYNDGDPILRGTGGADGHTTWFNLGVGAYCWYDNDSQVYKEYGALYNWHAVATGKLCPVGWHVPTHLEWYMMITFLGGQIGILDELYQVEEIDWVDLNRRDSCINKSGFTPVLSGRLNRGGFFQDEGNWWTSTPGPEGGPYYVTFDYIGLAQKSEGYNVRCMKD